MAAAGTLALATCAASAASAAGTGRPALAAITPASPHTAASPVAARAVTIRNFAFRPHIVTVKRGVTVRWTNKDSTAHTVTSDTGAFGSPVLQPGVSFSVRFTRPGAYRYHCSIHPSMTGEIVVS